MAIITISRLTGSGGREIASAVAETLKFEFIDRNDDRRGDRSTLSCPH